MSVTPFEEFIFEPITKVCNVTGKFDKLNDLSKFLIARNARKIYT